MPMTAATFSPDGSILAVAAETVFTLWDPGKNVLVAVIGHTIAPICNIAFVAHCEYLVSISRDSKRQLAVWNLSKLSMHWSYQISAEAICTAKDGSQFAILVVNNLHGKACKSDAEGIILLFEAENPIPLATWGVRKAKGGGLAFISPDLSLNDTKFPDEGSNSLLAYINGDHQYVVFNPHAEVQIARNARTRQSPDEEPEHIGYTSIYGELPEIDMHIEESISEIPFMPSERIWETIFTGSSHNLPPLTKLCATFFESLMEKNPTV